MGDCFVQLLLFLQGKCNYYLSVIFDTGGGLIVEPLLFTSDFSRDRFGLVTDKLFGYLYLSDHSLNSLSYFSAFGRNSYETNSYYTEKEAEK